ncbi:MAG TPA: ABC transporter substrate-binding protein [Firmicutes bacterium]|nr:ABC transporter substrate-binding protein [Bacillota bacterium]
MKKRCTAALVFCLLLTLASGVAYGEPLRLKVAYNPMPFNLPSIIERTWALLQQEGIEVEYESFTVGYAMSEAMAAGSLDIAPAMGLTSAVVARAGGRDIKITGVYSQAPAAFGLAVKPGTLDLGGLLGARIAVPIGTEAHLLLTQILAEQGLTIRDVQLVNMLIPDGLAALQSGQVDGAMVVEPVMSRLESAGQIEVIRDGTGLISGMTVTVIPERMLGSPALKVFEDAHGKSLRILTEERGAALQAAAEVLGLPLELVEHVAEKYSFQRDITPEVLQAIEDTVAFLFKEGVIRKPVPIDELL